MQLIGLFDSYACMLGDSVISTLSLQEDEEVFTTETTSRHIEPATVVQVEDASDR